MQHGLVNLALGVISVLQAMCIAFAVSVFLSASASGTLPGPVPYGTIGMLYGADTGRVFVSAYRAMGQLRYFPFTTIHETIAIGSPGDLYLTDPDDLFASVDGIVTDLHLSNIDPHRDFRSFQLHYAERPDGPPNRPAHCNDASQLLICIPEPASTSSTFGLIIAIAGLRNSLVLSRSNKAALIVSSV